MLVTTKVGPVSLRREYLGPDDSPPTGAQTTSTESR
jgi:hypothetical protein